MTKQELEERLNQALESYKTDTLALSDPYGTFYALHEFKPSILGYPP